MASIGDTLSNLFNTVVKTAAKNINVGVNSNGKVVLTTAQPVSAITTQTAQTTPVTTAAQTSTVQTANTANKPSQMNLLLVGAAIAAALVVIALKK
ncbi:MAG TPA: hypothetical protein PKY81_15060 [bacterium]|nr:hypothetical protein [bacterium]HPN32269.1 hypothetical protein [bacterium]